MLYSAYGVVGMVHYLFTDLACCVSLLCCCSHAGLGEADKPVDLVLSCVDNFEARMAINQVEFVLH